MLWVIGNTGAVRTNFRLRSCRPLFPIKALALLLLALTGCAAGREPEPVDSDHPASPQAMAVPPGLPEAIRAVSDVPEIAPADAAEPMHHGAHGGHP